ncbi:MAG TPA: L-aspartate oxidase [Ornithinimicrobium sp.]|uniref:L-aspartate oxidase n=1 Tax=Ornithinimicrobium sp. TaxID=1977084 RepID=UPI002B474A47|nr:L-aspartate oxidase [Ornithinimicrobium sp.]HKJ11626.1 L-aspartate oxidase [Ornithinimicrobium sp.]
MRRAEAGGLPVVVGAGLAGLMTAVNLAPRPCLVLTTGRLGTQAATGWAQGGIAAAIGAQDSPDLHAADTLATGAGLCDPQMVRAITAAAPVAVRRLADLGARFDRTAAGALRLGLEGAHSRRRIVHAGGDGSGAEVLRAVTEAVRATDSVTVWEHSRAVRVLTDPQSGAVSGVQVQTASGEQVVPTTAVVLATGGYGALWQHTSNPLGARGQGLAMAARAGARLRDLEMAQFHPTSLHAGMDPMPLISEAVRGEGATLVDAHGQPLPGDPLAGRDVVSRAVWAELREGGEVFLDARAAIGDRFRSLFPGIDRACRRAGIDPSTELVPIHPAAHYQCGGVEVDRRGRTSVPGLWAVGEVASTGLHGANRLASNSLLEAVVCAGWVAADLDQPQAVDPSVVSGPSAEMVPPAATAEERSQLRQMMSRCAGVVRREQDLAHAVHLLSRRAGTDVERLRDEELVALLVCHGALHRRESRGGHLREDYPRPAEVAQHTVACLEDLQAHVGSAV